jgi:hypothetical protein
LLEQLAVAVLAPLDVIDRSAAAAQAGRQTWFRIEAAGFAVRTEGASPGRIERKVDIPDTWVRGFLQLQGAMAMPGTRVVARPVDLLAAVRFLGLYRAKTSPRALRYEFEPGRPVQIVLEPWEQVIPLKGPGAEHNYTEKRVIRTWGRRRLKLLEPLLPFAESVTIYLKGRALPSFYAVRLPGITFLLGLSGWTGNSWTGTGSFDLLTADVPLDERLLGRAAARLAEKSALDAAGLASVLGVKPDVASALLAGAHLPQGMPQPRREIDVGGAAAHLAFIRLEDVAVGHHQTVGALVLAEGLEEEAVGVDRNHWVEEEGKNGVEVLIG